MTSELTMTSSYHIIIIKTDSDDNGRWIIQNNRSNCHYCDDDASNYIVCEYIYFMMPYMLAGAVYRAGRSKGVMYVRRQ
jgi:hypothetical protein